MQESSSTGRPETEHRKRIEVIWLGFHTTAWSWVGVARVTLLQEGCREEYRLKPVSCIFLDGAHVDEAKMLFCLFLTKRPLPGSSLFHSLWPL